MNHITLQEAGISPITVPQPDETDGQLMVCMTKLLRYYPTTRIYCSLSMQRSFATKIVPWILAVSERVGGGGQSVLRNEENNQIEQ